MATWDIDIFAFIDLRKKQGDERLRAHNLSLAIAADDVFMSRVEKYNELRKQGKIEESREVTYTLFDPKDVPDLPEIFGDEFKERYEWYEKDYLANPKKYNNNTEVRKVYEIVSHLMKSVATTHYPYFTFIDTVNKKHPHYEKFGKVRAGNLCLDYNTRVLTEHYDNIAIGELYDKLSNSLDTEIENVSIWNGYRYINATLKRYKEDDIYEIKFSNYISIKANEEHKWFIGEDDNNYLLKKTTKLVKGDKIPLVSMPNVIPEGKWYDEEFRAERFSTNILKEIDDILSKGKYVDNSIDKDGKQYISIPCDDMYEATNVVRLFNTIGVECRLENIPLSPFVLIYSFYIRKMIKAGLDVKKHNNLKTIILSTLSHVNDTPRAKILGVEKCKFRDEVYCFNEPKYQKFVAEGLITHNCQEVMMPADDNQIAVCNLSSINISKIKDDYELLRRVSTAVTRFLDNSIDTTSYPTDFAKNTQKSYRSIGVGTMGEAEHIANLQINFGSKEHIDWIHKFYSKLREYVDDASIKLAEERGSCDIEGIRNAYRLCIAPNTSTSLYAYTTAGIEPAYGKIFTDSRSKNHTIKMTAPNINVNNYMFYKTAFEIDQRDMIDATAARQEYIDMSISHSIFLDLTNNGENKVSYGTILDLYIYAWRKGLKSLYYLRDKAKDNSNVKEVTCESCAN